MRFFIFLTSIFLHQTGIAQQEQPLVISAIKTNQLVLKDMGNGEFQIETTGGDPYLFTKPLDAKIDSSNYILSFDYFSTKPVETVQVFFSPPTNENRSVSGAVGYSEGWTTFSIDASEMMDKWGKKGDFLRIDFGTTANRSVRIKNVRLRKPTLQDIEIALNKERKKAADSLSEKKLVTYLKLKSIYKLQQINVLDSTITIHGTVNANNKDLFLAEIPLHKDIAELTTFGNMTKLPSGKNTIDIIETRFVKTGDFTYDRLLSKWAIVEQNSTGFSLVSHARYADSVKPMYDLPELRPLSKKGIGGFNAGGKAPVSDLDDLNIGSVTVNIWMSRLMRSKPSNKSISFDYGGKTFYADKAAIDGFDKTFRETFKRKILVSAIILIDKAIKCPDTTIGRIFEHPDIDPSGIYSMPNMTTEEGVLYYAAIIDFFAQRYSRPDGKYGRIHHWIMHNEVDAGWSWTNMGEKTPLLFMDEYHKSMRMVHNIARKYNKHAKTFISLTHYWAWTPDKHFYHSDELLDILLNYSAKEGDFEWAIAQHPYPEDLREPKGWLDKKLDYTFKTPIITYKNIEVLDAWVKQPRTQFLGKFQRTIHLSEQGTNSKDYTEQSLAEQAAGMAYAWKKMAHLESIEAFQYHNWMDNRNEGGLRIGLRRFPDDADAPAGKKPVWYIFRDAATPQEEASFYLSKMMIGLKNWEEVIYKGVIK
jgi:Family of unknown function (DUF5722)